MDTQTATQDTQKTGHKHRTDSKPEKKKATFSIKGIYIFLAINTDRRKAAGQYRKMRYGGY